MKRFLFMLLFLLTTLLSGCTSLPKQDNAETPTTSFSDTPQPPADDFRYNSSQFDAFTDSILKKELSSNILNLHNVFAHPERAGIEDYAISLGSFSTHDDTMQYICLKEYLETLSTFDYQALTHDQQFTYDIFKTYCEDAIKFESFRLYSNYLSSTNGVQIYLPTLLSSYIFYDEQDILDYFTILKLFPSFFEDLIAFSNEQINAGTFLSDIDTENAINSCKQFLLNQEQHFLIESFQTRLKNVNNLTETEKNTYQTKHKEILKTFVFPAYTYLVTELEDLKGKCQKQHGLAWLEKGKEYYELLVREATGSEKTVSTLRDLIQKNMENDFHTLVKLGLEHPDAIQNMEHCPVDLSNPEIVLQTLNEQIKTDFPTSTNVNFQVQSVPESMEAYTNPAYYILPPLDNLEENFIFVNQSNFHGNIEDFVTLAHEGFPGHLYQTTYFYQTNPCPLRRLFSYNGYCEGWGTYAELYAYTLAGTDDVTARCNQLNKTYSLAIYCLADIGIHYDGWTLDETMDFFKELGLDTETGTCIYETLIANPAVYLSYYVGYLELMELRTLANQQLQERFDLKEFHRFILETGPAPFALIRKRMTIWMEKSE